VRGGKLVNPILADHFPEINMPKLQISLCPPPTEDAVIGKIYPKGQHHRDIKANRKKDLHFGGYTRVHHFNRGSATNPVRTSLPPLTIPYESSHGSRTASKKGTDARINRAACRLFVASYTAPAS